MNEKLALKINGKIVLFLSERLVNRQKLTDDEIQTILNLHKKRWNKVELMKTLDTKDLKALHAIRDQIEEIDFKLQDIWKFGRDKNFHRFFDLPHCTCPKLDNEERIGYEYKIYAEDCPLHH